MSFKRHGIITKSIIWPLVSVFIITFCCPPSYAVVTADHDPSVSTQNSKQLTPQRSVRKAKFAKGRFVVKFKAADLNQTQPAQPVKKGFFWGSAKPAKKESNFIRLHRKHKIKKYRKLQKLSKEKLKEKKVKQLLRKGKLNASAIARGEDPVAHIPDSSMTYVLEVDETADIESIVEEYKLDPNVAFAQPDYAMEVRATMNDPFYGSLWGMEMIQAPQAWDHAQGEGVIVAIVDTGIQYTHEDLAANMWINPGEIANNGIDDDGNGFIDDMHGWDFVNSDNDPWDGHYHGTHVAGTVAAVGNNGIGVVGVAPQAKLMALKGLSDTGSGWSTDLAAGIEYAALNGASVINNSWGCSSECPSNPVVEEAVRTAHGLNVMIVFAAGNSNADTSLRSPNNMWEVVSVASSTSSDSKSSFSNWGTMIDVIAPRSSVYSTYPGNSYTYLSGTSMASPHVAGLAALIISSDPTLSNEEVRTVIRSTADEFGDPGFDIYGGHGRINAYNAVVSQGSIVVQIQSPGFNDVINSDNTDGFLDIVGTVDGDDLLEYSIEYKPTDNSFDWTLASGPFNTAVTDDVLGDLPLENLSGGYLIKVTAEAIDGSTYEDFVEVEILNQNPLISKIFSETYYATDLEGRYAAWSKRNYADNHDGDLYYLDTVTDEITKVTNGLEVHSIDIHKDQILFTHWVLNNHHLYLYDIPSETLTFLLTRNVAMSQPDLSDDFIYWIEIDTNTYKYHIQSYDRSSGQISQFLPDEVSFSSPFYVFDHKFVWREAGPNVYFYNHLTGVKEVITQAPFHYDFDGNKVVWHERSDYVVRTYDVNTKQREDIKSSISLIDLEIFGNQISYIEFTTGRHLYTYDLETDEEEQITRYPSYWRSRLHMSEDKIIWSHTIANTIFEDIYLYDPDMINYPPTLADIGNQAIFVLRPVQSHGHRLPLKRF